nr:Dihydroxyacetone kinase [Klebsiella pneumoniae]
MLIVGDDISLPDNKQPRGIAGTILVHKVAGYFAERGFNLATVLREAQYAASHTASIGWRWPAATCRRKPTARRAIRPVTPSWEWASTVSRAPRRSPRKTVQKSLT